MTFVSRWAALGLGLGLMATGGRASADDNSVLDTRHDRGASPQNFAVEVRVALYQPQVDSDPALHGATPYASTFGTGFYFEGAMELDWQAIRIPDVGTLGPGISVGYTNMSGTAQRIDGGYPPSAESTTLEILPIYLVGVFRLDTLWRQLHVPLVPYAKAGLAYALWRASNTVGTSVAPNGVVGEGHTWGTQLAAGLAFNIGVLDPTSVRQLDEATGINNTYLFAEYMVSTLDGIAQKDPLRVGSDSFAFGVTFEF
ncbi:MAG: MXAN_2562 family outer membrane beta-barrel protein [Polyangiaceae bacterium]